MKIDDPHLVEFDLERELVHDGGQVEEEAVTGDQTRLDVDHGALLVAPQRRADPLQRGLARAAVGQQRVKHLVEKVACQLDLLLEAGDDGPERVGRRAGGRHALGHQRVVLGEERRRTQERPQVRQSGELAAHRLRQRRLYLLRHSLNPILDQHFGPWPKFQYSDASSFVS